MTLPAAAGTLARIDTGAGERDVVIQPTKQGFLFVLDRSTGQPVWQTVEEGAVPQGGAPWRANTIIADPADCVPRPICRCWCRNGFPSR